MSGSHKAPQRAKAGPAKGSSTPKSGTTHLYLASEPFPWLPKLPHPHMFFFELPRNFQSFYLFPADLDKIKSPLLTKELI